LRHDPHDFNLELCEHQIPGKAIQLQAGTEGDKIAWQTKIRPFTTAKFLLVNATA
jgi:hypothetical protein